MNVYERFKEYDKDHCWQYEIRLQNREQDLSESGLTEAEVAGLRCEDFDFEYVPKDDKPQCQEIKRFIERHEWLGNIPLRPTHRFTARYKGQLAGVIIMATPNAFGYYLGKENRHLEKLIARGAGISWGPKNLGSWLITKAIDWMVENTQFRIFTAYSDPEAKELGTIYQACNFYYLGQKSGGVKMYRYPDRDKWFSDRTFRTRGAYKRYAKELGIEWQKEWLHNGKERILWDQVPDDIEAKLRQASKDHLAMCECRVVPPKHKYALVKGASKSETRRLRREFEKAVATKKYPTERGK